VAWLVVLAGALALVGAFTPWFRPKASAHGRSISARDSVYTWDDGKIGILASVLLVLAGFGVLALLLGKASRRFTANGRHPVENAGRTSMIAGAVGLVVSGGAWILVPHQYKQWDEIQSEVRSIGGTLSRGPQIGFFLTVAAAILALVGGAVLIAAHRRKGSVS
jgi:Co/Zn/Cd efflux system component